MLGGSPCAMNKFVRDFEMNNVVHACTMLYNEQRDTMNNVVHACSNSLSPATSLVEFNRIPGSNTHLHTAIVDIVLCFVNIVRVREYVGGHWSLPVKQGAVR
jgi:hypothetical protein